MDKRDWKIKRIYYTLQTNKFERFRIFFIDVLLFHIITLVFFFQSDLGQIQFPEMGIFFFLIFYRGAKIPEQKKKRN